MLDISDDKSSCNLCQARFTLIAWRHNGGSHPLLANTTKEEAACRLPVPVLLLALLPALLDDASAIFPANERSITPNMSLNIEILSSRGQFRESSPDIRGFEQRLAYRREGGRRTRTSFQMSCSREELAGKSLEKERLEIAYSELASYTRRRDCRSASGVGGFRFWLAPF